MHVEDTGYLPAHGGFELRRVCRLGSSTLLHRLRGAFLESWRYWLACREAELPDSLLVGGYLLFVGHLTHIAVPSAPTFGPGIFWSALSGLTSFVSHAGGPPISAYTLPLRLDPRVLSGTMAVFFAAVNASKWLPYAWLGLIDLRNMATSLVLLPIAPIGVLVGVKLARRISPVLFYRLVYWGMFLTGVKLVWDAVK